MSKALKSLLTAISYVNVVFLFSLMVVTVIDVVARYVFNTSFLDAMTISSYLLAIMNALALAGITYTKGHVQVEIIYDRLPLGLKNTFNSVNSLLASVLFFIMAWFSFAKAAESYRSGLFQGWMNLPEYPAKFVFAFGCLMMAITFFVLFINVFFNKNGRKQPNDRILSADNYSDRDYQNP